MDWKNKYLKYKQKYFDLKKTIIGGAIPILNNDDEVNKLIQIQKVNINDKIRDLTTGLIQLDDSIKNDFLQKINSFDKKNELGKGQYGTVYNLSPSYVLKKVKIIQNHPFTQKPINKENDILQEIRTGFFVEFLNRKIDLYSGNLSFFKHSDEYYIIMNKNVDLTELEKFTDKDKIYEVSLSFICQLFIITLFLKQNIINHGDEKFDNLMFKPTDRTIDYFDYNINGTTFKIKNCGFKLKLIDWGEADIITADGPIWNEAWISGFKKGSKDIKKNNDNRDAPTTDYLINISKILNGLGLLKEFVDFNDFYINTINNIVDNDKEFEKYKYNIIIGDNSNTKSLLREISIPSGIKINNIYNIFKRFYETKEYNFLIDSNNTPNEHINNILINFNIKDHPQISYEKIVDTIDWEYCDIGKKNIYLKKILYTEFIKNIINYLNTSIDRLSFTEVDKSSKPPKIDSNSNLNKICSKNNIKSNTGALSSGSINYYKFKNFNINDTYKDIQDIKKKLEIIFKFDIKSQKKIDNLINIFLTDNYIIIVKKDDDDYLIYIFKHTGLQYIGVSDEEPYINHVELINYGGICLSDKGEIKDTFNKIVEITKQNNIEIDLSPVGFFHYHLNYNKNLDMFFGVVHAKIELTSELDETTPKTYLAYKFTRNKSNKIFDLTIDTNTLKKEHNYIFSIDNTDTFKLYNTNCESKLFSGNGLQDSFFNTNSFADLNYYGNEPRNKYVHINYRPNKINIFNFGEYKTSCDLITLTYTPAELAEILSLNYDENDYKNLRVIATHDEAKEVLKLRKNVEQYINLRGIDVVHADALSMS